MLQFVIPAVISAFSFYILLYQANVFKGNTGGAGFWKRSAASVVIVGALLFVIASLLDWIHNWGSSDTAIQARINIDGLICAALIKVAKMAATRSEKFKRGLYNVGLA